MAFSVALSVGRIARVARPSTAALADIFGADFTPGARAAFHQSAAASQTAPLGDGALWKAAESGRASRRAPLALPAAPSPTLVAGADDGATPSATKEHGVGKLAALTLDKIFKRAFGDDPENGPLAHLLNSVMRSDSQDHEIASIDAVELSFPGASTTIFDIRCTLKSGAKIIVELQKAPMRSQIYDRMFGYVARDYTKQWFTEPALTDSKKRKYALIPVRGLAILDFILDDSVAPLSHRRANSGQLVQHYYMQPSPSTVRPYAKGAARIAELADLTIVQLPLAPTMEEVAAGLAMSPAEKWAHLLHYSPDYRYDTLPDVLKEGKYDQAVQCARLEKMSSKDLEQLELELLSAAEWKDNATGREEAEAERDVERARREAAEKENAELKARLKALGKKD
jgi:hypothetical protein